MPMNPEIKKQWIADLRSGEYPQGKGSLRNINGGYCCLGVLGDQMVKAGKAVWAEPNKGSYYHELVTTNDGNKASGLITEAVQDWCGLTSESPTVNVNNDISDGPVHLTSLNDINGWTFAQIADAIEKDENL